MNKKYIGIALAVGLAIASAWTLTESFYCHSLATTLPLDAPPNYQKSSEPICVINDYFLWIGLPFSLVVELVLSPFGMSLSTQ